MNSHETRNMDPSKRDDILVGPCFYETLASCENVCIINSLPDFVNSALASRGYTIVLRARTCGSEDDFLAVNL